MHKKDRDKGFAVHFKSIVKDIKADCYSVMCMMEIGEYIRMIDWAYNKRGGIERQRDVLKTNTALRIRRRMVKDLLSGAVLPPVVLGISMAKGDFFDGLGNSQEIFSAIFDLIKDNNICIIDGMQRSTAIIEATSINVGLKNSLMRVEFWVATNMNSMIYRMLVLNSGQVPWSIRKQIETIFIGQIDELIKSVPSIEILRVEDQRRRSQPRQYPADDLIELYLAFGSRKDKVETRERLADEFTRLDITEATSYAMFMPIFYGVVKMMADLDEQFGKIDNDSIDEICDSTTVRFKCGKDLFGSQPARVGFFTALSQYIFGRPGSDQKKNSNEIYQDILSKFTTFCKKLSQMDTEVLASFIDFETLNEVISKRSGKVGSFEREFFTTAFRALIDDGFSVDTMRICWMAF